MQNIPMMVVGGMMVFIMTFWFVSAHSYQWERAHCVTVGDRMVCMK